MVCKREAYIPSTVSLGPYNHFCNTLNEHKQEAVRRMVTRINRDGAFLVKEIHGLERDIRECYDEKINCDVETLCCLMVYDACFILEFFRCSGRTRVQNPQGCFSLVFQNKDYKNSMYNDILSDIMKLENQVPLNVLIAILRLEFDPAIPELAKLLSNSELFKGFPFYSSLPDDGDVKLKLEELMEKNPYHLLDLYRMVINDILKPSSLESDTPSRSGWMQLPCSPNERCFIPDAESLDEKRSTPCAQKLQNAGIEFEPGKIRFKRSKLGISMVSLPQITVNYMTEIYLRNLMAYEECQRCSWNPKPTVISNYIRLLDIFINSEKDVSVLRDARVIKSFVGCDEDIVKMFNHLTIGITVGPLDCDTAVTINRLGSIREYEDVLRQVREHYNSKWNVWIGQFREEHCSNPLYALSFLAATGLLVMTIIQTVYAMK
ncbi:putative UPF0481 protein At3g02645 [Cryptomeria japonica]|uniref:putative UPF0481 protein At3g02645 n=1 Tax=Cryptomeria japonica TaxID=3369 RepID=UPI0025AB70EA|nr:putative UPF0481 protein At3g02645 [Cryptomeria japonica]